MYPYACVCVTWLSLSLSLFIYIYLYLFLCLFIYIVNLHMYFPLMSIYIYSQLRMTLRSHEVKAGFLHDNADIGSLSLGFQSGSGFPVSKFGLQQRELPGDQSSLLQKG